MQLHTSIKKRSLPWSCLSTDHPSSDSTLFSKAVSQLAAEGGGWLTWVVAVDDISKIKKYFGCAAVDGQRTKPDGKNLTCKQTDVLGTLEDKQLPFFTEWLPLDHPQQMEKPLQRLLKSKLPVMSHVSKSGLCQNSVHPLVQMLKLNGLRNMQLMVIQQSLQYM
jgi:hypothetical protein